MLTSLYTAICRPLASRSRLILSATAISRGSITETKEDTTNIEQPIDTELVQVIYVTRHGLRTPLSDSNEIVRGFEWECLSQEETEDIFTNQVELHRADEGPERGVTRDQIKRYRIPPGKFEPTFSGDKLIGFGKNCHSGQLTLAGHKQMRAVGEKVGQRYKKDVPLLPEEWDPSLIAVRSTNSARTIETALELLNGMYAKRDGNAVRVELHAVNSETMYPHSSCSFLGSAFKAYRASPARAAIKAELAAQFDKTKFKTDEEFDFWTRRSLPALCNTVATLTGHGFPLPEGILPSHLDVICNLSGKEYEAMYRQDPRMSRLGIGRFLGEIVDVLKEKVEYDLTSKGEQLIGMATSNEPAPPKFVLMSGHDNTIAPLIMNLELLSGTHPPMGAGLAFELYKSKPVTVARASNGLSDPEYFVQAVYNFQPLPIPSCGNKLLCPFDEFVRLTTLRTPANYHAECDTLEQTFPAFQ